MHNLLIFSTQASNYFSLLIAKHLGICGHGEIVRRVFGGGEKYYRIGVEKKTGLLGRDVVFVGSAHTDDDLEELYRIGRALVGYGARRIIFVIPFLGYSTMDRAASPGEVVTAKTVACKLSAIPSGDMRNTFLMMDLHVSGLVHYFEGNCLRFELSSEDILLETIKKMNYADNFVVGTGDLGRPKLVKIFAKKLGTNFVLVDKDREFEKVVANGVIGDVQGKLVFIYDDMTRSGDTLVEAATVCRKAGAVAVGAVLNHLALNNEGVARKLSSSLFGVISTNTHSMSRCGAVRNSDKFVIKDVSGIFADSIKSILNY